MQSHHQPHRLPQERQNFPPRKLLPFVQWAFHSNFHKLRRSDAQPLMQLNGLFTVHLEPFHIHNINLQQHSQGKSHIRLDPG